VRALNDVNFTVRQGEIHALVGENGAGKSTLMKVLSGVYPHGDYDGNIVYDGEERHFRDITDSEALGIIIIHQELALIPLLSIAENIFIASPPSRFGVIDRDAVYKRSQQLLAKVGLNEAPDTLVTNIGVGKQQLVEIAKALSKQVRLLILDEATASLNESDSAALLDLLLEFRSQGMSAILISHKLNEVARVADRITVLRDGRTVDTLDCEAGAVEEDRISARWWIATSNIASRNASLISATSCSRSRTGRSIIRSMRTGRLSRMSTSMSAVARSRASPG
jgi:putative multiple sugar transport system ATP-binding protein